MTEEAPRVWVDFNRAALYRGEWRTLLDLDATQRELEENGIRLVEGLRLTLYDYDADADGHPALLLADGVVGYDSDRDVWYADWDESGTRWERTDL